ncbi:hypothetical protein P3S68_014461 [Capsicum galapagoense]
MDQRSSKTYQIYTTLWEKFIDHDGANILEKINQYPIILARKVVESRPGLTTRFATTIQIDPPYPIKTNKQLLIAYRKKSTAPSGSLQFIPFQDEVISVATAQEQPQILCQFEVTVADSSGSIAALIADETAKQCCISVYYIQAV